VDRRAVVRVAVPARTAHRRGRRRLPRLHPALLAARVRRVRPQPGGLGKPAITVGSVGLDTEFWDSLNGGTGAVAGIDDLLDLLDRLESDEFDLVADPD
jgi:hypothetical protein